MQNQINQALKNARIQATAITGYRDSNAMAYELSAAPGTSVRRVQQALEPLADKIHVVRTGPMDLTCYVIDNQPVTVVEEHHHHYHTTINVTVNVVLDELEGWANKIGGRVHKRGAVAYLLDDVGRCIHETAIA